MGYREGLGDLVYQGGGVAVDPATGQGALVNFPEVDASGASTVGQSVPDSAVTQYLASGGAPAPASSGGSSFNPAALLAALPGLTTTGLSIYGATQGRVPAPPRPAAPAQSSSSGLLWGLGILAVVGLGIAAAKGGARGRRRNPRRTPFGLVMV